MSATARMLVTSGGARWGTVGGGCLEAEITERALEVIERRVPAVSEHSLNAELAGDYGLTCGGTAMMFIEPVLADPALARVYDACASLLARGERGVIATALNWDDGAGKIVVTAAGTIGTTSAVLQRAAARLLDIGADKDLSEGTYAEVVSGPPRLVVFGAGHVGARVGEAASFAGWRVTMVDDRPEFADPSRLPFADQCVVCDFHDLPAALALDSQSYAVVATRGHQHDALIVEQLARLELRYLGMLGSRRKVVLTRELLERAGVLPVQLDEMHAPVGLSIGADTPEEIAISIVAEMISVRRAGSMRRGGIIGTATTAGATARRGR